MENDKVIQGIKRATNNFTKGYTMSTAMGWFPKFDEEGRPLNADPNYISGEIKLGETTYYFVRRGWKVRVWDRKAFYMDFVTNKQDFMKEIDLTPEYIKNE